MMDKTLKTLIGSEDLTKEIKNLADRINAYYAEKYSLNEELTIVCV